MSKFTVKMFKAGLMFGLILPVSSTVDARTQLETDRLLSRQALNQLEGINQDGSPESLTEVYEQQREQKILKIEKALAKKNFDDKFASKAKQIVKDLKRTGSNNSLMAQLALKAKKDADQRLQDFKNLEREARGAAAPVTSTTAIDTSLLNEETCPGSSVVTQHFANVDNAINSANEIFTGFQDDATKELKKKGDEEKKKHIEELSKHVAVIEKALGSDKETAELAKQFRARQKTLEETVAKGLDTASASDSKQIEDIAFKIIEKQEKVAKDAADKSDKELLKALLNGLKLRQEFAEDNFEVDGIKTKLIAQVRKLIQTAQTGLQEAAKGLGSGVSTNMSDVDKYARDYEQKFAQANTEVLAGNTIALNEKLIEGRNFANNLKDEAQENVDFSLQSSAAAQAALQGALQATTALNAAKNSTELLSGLKAAIEGVANTVGTAKANTAGMIQACANTGDIVAELEEKIKEVDDSSKRNREQLAQRNGQGGRRNSAPVSGLATH